MGQVVLVTGGSGFIGRHAVTALVASGATVLVLGRGERSVHLSLDAEWRSVDLLSNSKDALRSLMREVRPQILLHLAWETSHGLFWSSRTNLAWVSASVDLVDAFLEAGGERIIVSGSCAEYEPPSDGPCIENTTPIGPQTLYGASKDALRRVLHALHSNGDTSYAWARLFFAYGPDEHERRLVPSIVNALLSDRRAQCSSGIQIRDFLHVRDYGRALSALALSQVTGEVNVGSGTPVRIADLVQSVGRIVGATDLIDFGALPDRPDEPPTLWADISRLQREVGFVPDTTLEAGLKETIEWWKVLRR